MRCLHNWLRFSLPVGLLVLSGAWLTSPASAQVVQLPTFRFFTVSTTVSVPDSGRGFLGGVKRSRRSRTGRGVPIVGKVPGLGRLARNQGIGSAMSSSGASVTAQIIDHRELDEATRALARRSHPATDPRLAGKAAYLAGNLATHEPPARPDAAVVAQARAPSAAEIARRNEAAQQKRDAELQDYIARGRKAEAAGKLGAARIYYKMAAKRAPDGLKTRIMAYVQTLNKPKPQPKPATETPASVTATVRK